MTAFQIPDVRVRGVVGAVPGAARDIATLDVPWTPDEIAKTAKTVGLRALHRAPAGMTAGDLCHAAALALLEDLGWSPDSIDGLIFVTQTPDHFLPATSCILHGRLGLPDSAFAFDVGMGCSGYVYGLWMASRFVSPAAKRVLLLAGDTISQLTSPEDKSVAVLFGDAGSATALEFEAGAPPMHFVLGTDGSGSANLQVPGGGFRQRYDPSWERSDDGTGNRRGPGDLFMDGLAIFNFTLDRVPALVTATLAAHGWDKDQPDAFFFHQANGFILGRLAKKMGLPADRIPLNIDRYGNTSLASIPLLLADDLASRLRHEGLRAVLAGFGVGYSWAGAALEIGPLGAARVVTVPVES